MKIYNEISNEQEAFFWSLHNKINKRKALIEKKIEQIKHPLGVSSFRAQKN